MAYDLTGLIPTDALQIARGVLAANMDQLCQIQRPANDPDMPSPIGTDNNAMNIIASDVPCRVHQLISMGAFERMLAERLNAVVMWNIYVPPGTDVQARDTITVGQETFEIASVRGDTRSTPLQTKIVAVKTA